MNHTLKILISENNTHIKNSLSSYFNENNVTVEFCEKDGMALLDKIKHFSPDVVICDVFMRKMDAIDMKQAAVKLDNPPKFFFIASSIDNENIIRNIINSGFDYYFIKPYSPESVYNRVLAMTGQSNNHGSVCKTEKEITDILCKFDMPPHLKGYNFIRQAILLVYRKPDMINNITKELYPEIARMNNTTATRVERAMRTAIELAWERADQSILYEYFHYHINSFSKPSNSEFIAKIADKLYINSASEKSS